MAVYEFECKACGKHFEVSVPISEHDRLKKRPPKCPKCGKNQLLELNVVDGGAVGFPRDDHLESASLQPVAEEPPIHRVPRPQEADSSDISLLDRVCGRIDDVDQWQSDRRLYGVSALVVRVGTEQDHVRTPGLERPGRVGHAAADLVPLIAAHELLEVAPRRGSPSRCAPSANRRGAA